ASCSGMGESEGLKKGLFESVGTGNNLERGQTKIAQQLQERIQIVRLMFHLDVAVGEHGTLPLPPAECTEQFFMAICDDDLGGAAPARLQIFQSVMHQHAASGDDDDLFADAIDVVQQMRGEHHRDAVHVPKAVDQFEHLHLAFRIEAVGRFIEKDYLRVM